MFIASAIMLITRLVNDKQQQTEFEALEKMITEEQPLPENATDREVIDWQAQKFAQLTQQNSDFAGWISIDDTPLSYPVMYHPSQEEYYLRRNFNGEYSVYGTPYIDEDCTLRPRSDNIIVYGHNIKTGSLFACLTGYRKAEYYTQHPFINLDTLYESHQYKVFAAFTIDVDTDTFAYNSFINADSEKQYDDYIAEVKRRSDVKTDDTPVFGDKLLLLSTCEYTHDNGRYVVVAYRAD